MSMSRTERRRVTRERRRRIARMLDEGRSLPEIARACGCGLDAVRQHVRALRESAQSRAVDEWGAAASATADLVEALEAAVLKVRAAQDRTELDTPNYRKLVWMEVYAIRQLMTVRRELAAARKAEPDAESEEVELTALSPEELVVTARAVGLSDSAILRAWPDAPGVEHPGGQGTRPDPLPPGAEAASGTCPRPAQDGVRATQEQGEDTDANVGAVREPPADGGAGPAPLVACGHPDEVRATQGQTDDAGRDGGAVREPPAHHEGAGSGQGTRPDPLPPEAEGASGTCPRPAGGSPSARATTRRSRAALPMPVPPRGPQRLSYIVRGRVPFIPFAPGKKAG